MFGLSQKTNEKLQIFVAAMLIMWQFIPLLSGSVGVYAAGAITANDHEGEMSDGSWSNGNITQYTEGEEINFRYIVESSVAATGQMKVQFTVDDSFCTFFDSTFQLGSIDNISGVSPSVNTVGVPSDAGSDWEQILEIDFSSAGKAWVNYTLTLSDEAGECRGSSQHSQIDDVGGDFAKIGVKTVPVPAKDIIELPEIFVTKFVDTDGDGQSDRTATEGEWEFSLDGGTPVATDSNGQVTFVNVTPDGEHTITEHNGPSNQSFISGGGTNCTFEGSTATATVASGTDATDATCEFLNGVQLGSITIIKDAVPNIEQNFSYTTTGPDLTDFMLDDDGDNSNDLSNTKAFDNLNAGAYTVTEVTGAQDGWTLAGILCDGSNTSVNVDTATATINLASGEDVTCTFTNHENGQIKVTKQTLPDGSNEDFSITASGDGTVFGEATRSITDDKTVTYDVTPGTYSVSEAEKTGWTETSNTCTTDNLEVEPGEVKTCTIENTQLAQVTIEKDAVPNGSQDFDFTFTGQDGFSLDDDDDPTLSNEKVIDGLLPGEYTVTEAAVEGWDLTSLTCDEQEGFDDSQTNEAEGTATINLSAGEVMSCTFENTERGSISGTKYEVDADDTTGIEGNELTGWTIQLWQNDSKIDETTTNGDGEYIFTKVKPGSYVVKEVVESGWTQIFPASPNYLSVTVEAGTENTENDFGNFENGSLTVYKYEDLNGNGEYDSEDERKLEGWEFTLTFDSNKDGEFTEIGTVNTTGVDGSYTFTNLAPGDYQICETPQEGWELTDPDPEFSDGCRERTINLSGEPASAYFGNRPIGTITVIKNLDMNDDDQADTNNVDSWRWYLNEDDSTTYATGSGNTIEVTANQDYTVSEMLKTDYHLSDVVCTGEEFAESSTTVSVSVSPGEDVVCTFLNSRDSGNITVTKLLNPSEDSGLFDFDLTGSSGILNLATNLSHNESDTLNVPTGNYSIEELAGTDTALENYDSEYKCMVGTDVLVEGSGVDTGEFELTKDQNIDCFFTNTRHGSISGTKNEANADESFVDTLSGWTISLWQNNTFVTSTTTDEDGNYSFDGLSPGDYSITEELQEDWTQIYSPSPVTLDAGGSDSENDFGNFRNASIQALKFHDINGNGEYDSEDENVLSNWTIYIDGTDRSKETNSDGLASFTNLEPGTYSVCEVEQTNWQRTFPADSNCQDVVIDESGETEEIMFGNQAQASITVTKQALPEDTQQSFDVEVTGTGDIISDSTTSLADNESETFTVGFGTYDVTEDVPDGWSESYDGCESIVVDTAGQEETCTITNTQLAQITIIKDAEPNGLQAFDFTFTGPNETNEGFTLDDNDDSAFSDQEVIDGLLPGEYTVSEASVEGWDLTSLTCDEQEGFDDSQTNLAEGTATINLSAGEVMSCTFVNTERGSIVVEKEVITIDQEPEQVFGFSVDGDNLTVPDTDSLTGGQSFTVENIKPGDYTITETSFLDNWQLTSISCSSEDEGSLETQSVDVTLAPGQEITCTFYNQELANVTVLKYNDLINRGVYDETENEDGIKDEPLEDWTMNLDSEAPEYENEINDVESLFFIPGFSEEDYSKVTGTDGLALFENIQPGIYSLSEVLQEGWELSDITCEIEREFRAGALVIENGNNSEVVPVAPGSDINCFVGNYQDLVLSIEKSNDQTAPELVGDTVVYTLEVSVPEDSGVSYNTVVTDLPPEGFVYQTGSWTAQSSVRGNLKTAGITTEPTYASPGDWQLGTMIPGETVTLTYNALINDASPGDYPDIAFVQGQDADESTVFGNLHITENDPFVGTVASVIEVDEEADVVFAAEERVLGIQNLPATGPENNWIQIFLIPALLGMAYYLLDRRFSYAFQRRREQ